MAFSNPSTSNSPSSFSNSLHQQSEGGNSINTHQVHESSKNSTRMPRGGVKLMEAGGKENAKKIRICWMKAQNKRARERAGQRGGYRKLGALGGEGR
jgi:hypothetical protein